MDVMSTVVYI